MDGTQLVEMPLENELADVDASEMRPDSRRTQSSRPRSNSPIEIIHGTWRCRISSDTKIRVTSQRRLTASLLLAGFGIALMIVGVALDVDPGFILAGGTLALLGADSCRRVRRVYTVCLDNGDDALQFLSFADAQRAEMLVAELSAEIKRVSSIGKRPPATERSRTFSAHAS